MPAPASVTQLLVARSSGDAAALDALTPVIQQQWQNRAHFFATLVNMARNRGRAKRGQGQLHVSLSEAAQQPLAQRADLMALDEAMNALELVDQRLFRVVELR